MRTYITLLFFAIQTLFTYAQCDQVSIQFTNSNECLPLAIYSLQGQAPEGATATWSWLENPGSAQFLLDPDDEFIVDVSMTQPGTYQLQMLVNLPTGEECIEVFEKEIFPLPVIATNLESNYSLCNDVVEINLNLINASEFTEADWVLGQEFSEGFEASFSLSEAGYFELHVLAVDNYGCTVNLTETVEVSQGPSTTNTTLGLIPNVPSTNCLDLGTNYQLNTNLASNFDAQSIYWLNQNETTTTNHSVDITVANIAEQSFSYPVELNFEDCTLSYELEHAYSATHPVTFNSSYNGEKLCAGEVITLSNTSNQLVWDANFAWDIPVATVISETANEVTFEYSHDGIYQWSLNYLGECASSITENEYVEVDIIEPILAEGINQLACSDSYTLNLDHATILDQDDDYLFEWILLHESAPAIQSNEESPSIVLTEEGTYDLSFSIVNVDGSCAGEIFYPNFFTLGAIDFGLVEEIQELCFGEPINTVDLIQNQEVAQYTYEWELIDEAFNTVSSASGYDAVLQAGEPGNYLVQLAIEDSQSSCADVVANNIVDVLTTPIVEISSENIQFCNETELNVFATSPNIFTNGDPLFFNWSLYQGAELVDEQVVPQYNYTLGNSGEYTLVAEFTSEICTGSDQIEISYEEMNAISSLEWQDLVSLCEGETISPIDNVVLPTSSSLNVQWNLLDFNTNELVQLSTDINANFVADPGEYKVEVLLNSDINDCTLQQDVSSQIIVNASPQLTINTDDLNLCELPHSLVAYAETDPMQTIPPFPWIDYSWELRENEQLLFESANYEFIYELLESGTYVLESNVLNTNTGCESVESVEIVVNDVQLDYLDAMPGEQCIDYALNPMGYFDAAGIENVSYLWQLIDETGAIYKSSLSANPLFLMDESGVFDLSVQLNSETNDCVYDTLLEDFVSIKNLEVVLEDAYTSCELPYEVSFNHNTDLSNVTNPNFLWTIYNVDGSVIETINQEEASYIYSTNGYYDVALTITDPVLGCSDTELMPEAVFIDAIEIILEDSSPFSSSCLPYSFNAGDIDLTQYADANYSYEWTVIDSLGNVHDSSENSIGDLTINQSGVYDLQFQLTNEDANCSDLILLEDFVIANDINMSIALLDSPNCFDGLEPVTKSIIVEDIITDLNTPINIVNHTWQVSPSQGVSAQISNQDSLVLAITEPGEYSIVYTLFLDNGSCVYNDAIIFSVGVIPGFDYPSTICVGEEFDISDNSSVAIGALTAYEWLPSAQLEVDNIYADQTSLSANSAGTHSLGLIVNNDLGCIDTLYQDVEVYEVIADFSLSDSLLLCSGSEVDLLSLNNDYIYSYIWTITEDFPAIISSSVPYHAYTFTEMGNSSVGLMIESIHGCADTLIKEDVITLDEFDIEIIAYDADSCFNTTSSIQKTFAPSISSQLGLDYNITSYGWQISPNSGVNTDYQAIDSLALQFTEPGEYTLSYTLMLDNGDCVYTDQINIDVGVITEINAPAIICAGLPFGVSENSSIAIGASTAYSWSSISNLTIDDYTSQTPNISAEVPGIYPLTLAVVNDMGCIASETVNVEVYDTQADFVLSDSIFDCTPASVQFQSLNNEYVTNYTWNISQLFVTGQSFTSNYTSVNPTYNYLFASSGISDIELIIETQHGCVDSILKVDELLVNEIDVSIEEDDNVCFNGQETVVRNFQAVFDADFETNLSLNSFLWTINPPENAVILAQDENSVQIEFLNAGPYMLSYQASSDDGTCSYSAGHGFSLGVQAEVEVPEVVCVGAEFQASANVAIDIGSESSFDWSGDPQLDVLSAQDLETIFIANEPGNYALNFTVTNDMGCWLTLTEQIVAYQVNALLTSPDSGEQCRPAIVDFESANNDYISSYTWNITQSFNEETALFTETTSSPEYTHLFNEVGLSDVELIVESEHGCTDTSMFEGFIDVIAPLPHFTLEPNFAGCDSFLVSIVDSSSFIDNYWIDFGNGLIPDYNIGETNTVMYHYPYDETTDWFYEYYINLHAEYKFCEASIVDTVRVYPRPQIEMTLSDSTGCPPFSVNFEDHSQYIHETWSSYHWEFGDGQVSNSENPTHVYEEPGVYQIYHSVTSQNQCFEDTVWTQTVEVFEAPVADFTAETHDYCYGVANVQFENLSAHNSDSLQYYWSYIFQDHFVQNPVFTFDWSGIHDINLTIVDSHGCVDDTTKFVDINILDTVVQLPLINFVSVENEELMVNWADTLDDNFGSLWLYHQNQLNDWDLIHYSESALPSQFSHEDIIATEQNNYYLLVEDSCGYYSEQSIEHSAMILDVASNQYQCVDLNWTPYIGWDSVAYYSIYRADMTANFEWIADVPSTSLHYLDTNLCNVGYAYYVQAAHPNQEFYSKSNIRLIEPMFIDFSQPMLLEYTSVHNDGSVITQWDTHYESEITYYSIDRWDKYFGWVEGFDVISESPYIDSEAASSHMRYKYRVTYEDYCGNMSPVSRIGTNVVLSGEPYASHYELSWTPYEEWEEGVASYRLQYFNADAGLYQDLVELDGDQFSYVDSDLDKPGIDTSYCYRLIAIGYDDEGYRSYSNELCFVSGVKQYFANAFTPNDDDINETFYFSGDFAKSLTISIYDRWGRKVFSSDSVDFEWDGYSDINGAQCLQGSYVVRYEIEGYDGSTIKDEMVLLLLR